MLGNLGSKSGSFKTGSGENEEVILTVFSKDLKLWGSLGCPRMSSE